MKPLARFGLMLLGFVFVFALAFPVQHFDNVVARGPTMISEQINLNVSNFSLVQQDLALTNEGAGLPVATRYSDLAAASEQRDVSVARNATVGAVPQVSYVMRLRFMTPRSAIEPSTPATAAGGEPA